MTGHGRSVVLKGPEIDGALAAIHLVVVVLAWSDCCCCCCCCCRLFRLKGESVRLEQSRKGGLLVRYLVARALCVRVGRLGLELAYHIGLLLTKQKWVGADGGKEGSEHLRGLNDSWRSLYSNLLNGIKPSCTVKILITPLLGAYIYMKRYNTLWIKNVWQEEGGRAGIWIGDVEKGVQQFDWEDLCLEERAERFRAH